ncbi:hypothetical protein LXL04_011751 [Taraxacum kok-saghyz]
MLRYKRNRCAYEQMILSEHIPITASRSLLPKIKEGGKRYQIHKMAENKEIPSQYDLNAKWDACLDLGVRRFVYSSATGAFVGLLLFRSPVTRWASIAFGAGIGIGSAYSDCSQKFDISNSTSPTIVKVEARLYRCLFSSRIPTAWCSGASEKTHSLKLAFPRIMAPDSQIGETKFLLGQLVEERDAKG